MSEKIILDDIANGQENVRIPVVNDIDDEEAPKIVYLQKRRALPIPDDNGVNLVDYLAKERESCPGCDCQDNCQTNESCSCRIKTKEEIDRWNKLWEITAKDKANPFEVFPIASYECNSNCKCILEMCTNRLTQKKITLPLQVFKTPQMGWGVRCSTLIPKGTFISTYSGTLLQRTFIMKLLLLRGKIISGSYMAKLIDIGRIYEKKPGEYSTIMNEWAFGIDAAIPVNGPLPGGNVSRFFNHSCAPNVISRLVFVETHDTRLPELAFFALRDIGAYEEIFWDYAYDVSPDSSFRCQCGSEECRWREQDDESDEEENEEDKSEKETPQNVNAED